MEEFDYIARKFDVEQLTYILDQEDPKEVILKKLGNVIEQKLKNIYGSRILVAIAPTPTIKSKLIFTDEYRDRQKDEGRWQGMMGLILLKGPTAFKYDARRPQFKWEGPSPDVGDWVYFKPTVTWKTAIRCEDKTGISGGIIWDSDIVGITLDIEGIY